MTQWIPKRLEVVNQHGQRTTMDVGRDAVVTVTVTGPYVNLELKDVKTLEMFCDERPQTVGEYVNTYCEHEAIGWRIDKDGHHFKCRKCGAHLRTEKVE